MNINFKKPRKNKNYVYIYWETLSEYNLTASETLLIYLIKGLSTKTGSCYASKKSLASILNTTEPTIHSLTNKLINKGLLKKCGFSEYKTSKLAPTYKFDEHIKLLKKIEI